MVRKVEFDILKGILIIFVVIGHTNLKIPYFDIFWFHMPAFFMVSGYLTKKWLTPKELISAIQKKDSSIIRKIGKYIFPYFSYSILFYILFSPEPILKNIIRVVYAGANNITVYSYPFWFINSLFIAILFIGYIKQWKQEKNRIIILLGIWIILHLNIMKLLPIPLPWGIDTALGAIVYIYLGNIAQNIKSSKWYTCLLILPIIFIFFNEYYGMNYKLNMLSMIYNHFLLDLIVPVIFTYFFYRISIILSQTPVISQLLSYIGLCSMTIYFSHAAILYATKELFHWDTNLRIICAIFIGILLHI